MPMPDVNVLVYAHRSDEAVHEFYRSWLEDALQSNTPFGLSTLVAGGFLRIVTNTKIYTTPTPIETALAAIDAIVTHPNCVCVGTDPDHITRLSVLCRAASVTGKQVADAQPCYACDERRSLLGDSETQTTVVSSHTVYAGSTSCPPMQLANGGLLAACPMGPRVLERSLLRWSICKFACLSAPYGKP